MLSFLLQLGDVIVGSSAGAGDDADAVSINSVLAFVLSINANASG